MNRLEVFQKTQAKKFDFPTKRAIRKFICQFGHLHMEPFMEVAKRHFESFNNRSEIIKVLDSFIK